MSHNYDDKNETDVRYGETRPVWIRGAIMLLLMFCFGFAQSLLFAMTVVQFLWMLVARDRNAFIADFGWSLAQWMAQSAKFLTGATDEKPFPWTEWPST
jgi:hypothetical protein